MSQEEPWYLKGFRKAKVASAGWNLFKTAMHTTFFWSIFLFALPFAISKLEVTLGISPYTVPGPPWWPWIGFAMFGTLGLSTGAIMAYVGKGTPLPLDYPNQLVLVGPYRYVRNPMAIAGLTQGLFVGLYLGSYLTILYIIAGGIIWNVFARPPEEHHLEIEFGQPYKDYKQSVPCWIPRLTPYTPPARPDLAGGGDEESAA